MKGPGKREREDQNQPDDAQLVHQHHARDRGKNQRDRATRDLDPNGAVSQSARRNATRSRFSCAVSRIPRIKLKDSTVSSSVIRRPSCRYGGESLIPRSAGVLIEPSPTALMPLIVAGA